MVELLAFDTGVAPFVVAGDSTTAIHSMLFGNIVAMADPLGSECTMVSTQTAVVVQPMFVVATE